MVTVRRIMLRIGIRQIPDDDQVFEGIFILIRRWGEITLAENRIFAAVENRGKYGRFDDHL